MKTQARNARLFILHPSSFRLHPSRRCIPGGRAFARPPVRHELLCAAPDGVADPEATEPDELSATALEVERCQVPANPGTQGSSAVASANRDGWPRRLVPPRWATASDN